MSLIALCADKGRPGVTTAALALAALWPRRAAVAELDQAGGDLVMRLTNPAGRYVLGFGSTARTPVAAGHLSWSVLRARTRPPGWCRCGPSWPRRWR